MPLAPGTKLGAHEILAPLGAGGMGEVYRARDPRLGREVAVKVLPTESLHDDTARARLLREARLAATLNHPNICTVYEVGEAGGHIYIAMELIDGRPLSEKIAERGTGLPTENVTRYGAQIAAALAHAHERHVIHRDLKSSNVVVMPDGRVKVLDFGVARRAWEAADEAARTLQVTLTEAGAIVGTPHYLAPEVLHGAKSDERSDLWAVGVLLHEMASGALPFRGTTGYELAAAILHDGPAALPERVPAGLKAVIGRCLSKEPGERYARASEVRAALEALQSDSAGQVAAVQAALMPPNVVPASAALPSAGRHSLRGVFIGMTVTMLAALLTGGWFAWRVLVPKPTPKLTQLTTNSGENPVSACAISADGARLLFADATGVYLREIASGQTRPVTLPPGLSLDFVTLRWFPDGERFAASFMAAKDTSDSGIWAISVAGWEPRKISQRGEWPIVSPDGSQIAYFAFGRHSSNQEIWVMKADGEDARKVAVSDSTWFRSKVAWSPDGGSLASALVEVGTSREILNRIDLASGKEYVLLDDTSSAGSPVVFWPRGDRILYCHRNLSPESGQDLWEISAASRSRGAPSAPRRVTKFQLAGIGVRDGTSSRGGGRLVFLDSRSSTDVFIGRLDDQHQRLDEVRRFTLDEKRDRLSAWSPDGASLLFDSDRLGGEDIFEQPLTSRAAHRVFDRGGDKFTPKPLRGGSELLYWASGFGVSGSRRLMRARREGGAPVFVLEASSHANLDVPCRADSFAIIAEPTPRGVSFTEVDPEHGRRRELGKLVVDSTNYAADIAWHVSEDGRQLAVVALGVAPLIHVLDLRTGRWRRIPVHLPADLAGSVMAGGVAWERDGRGFFITDSVSGLLLNSDPSGHSRVLYRAPQLIYDVIQSPNGRFVAFTSDTRSANAWMLEDF